jgi:hypothetical protein
MIKAAVVLLLIFALAGTVSAQADCASNLPCGPVPWKLPNWPRLASPTPMPTLMASTPVPTALSGGPQPTATATANVSDSIDTDPIGQQVATIGAIFNSTPVRLSDFNGAFEDDSEATPEYDFGGSAGTWFGYMRAIPQYDLGILTPLIAFFFLQFFITFSVQIGNLLLPMLAVLFGMIRKFIQFVLDFLPL